MKPSLGSGELLFVDEVLERRWASVVAIASIWNQFHWHLVKCIVLVK